MSRPLPDPVDAYLRVVEAVPPLSPQQELALWRTKEEGDNSESAKKRLIEANLRMVIPVAFQYEGRGVVLLDLIQEGNLGLLRAIERFDPSQGREFASFARVWIEDAIVSAVG
ncbi:MAG: sigma-70 family RNA polymerase sigma factor [Actinomycetota bacterium]